MKLLKKVPIPILTLILSCVWFFMGVTTYVFWDRDAGPMGGFFPTLVSVLLFVVSLAAICAGAKGQAPKICAQDLWVILSAAAIFSGTFLIGMLPSLLAYLLFWLLKIEKYSLRTTLLVTAVIFLIVYGVFVKWLMVPFPVGILFECVL